MRPLYEAVRKKFEVALGGELLLTHRKCMKIKTIIAGVAIISILAVIDGVAALLAGAVAIIAVTLVDLK